MEESISDLWAVPSGVLTDLIAAAEAMIAPDMDTYRSLTRGDAEARLRRAIEAAQEAIDGLA